MTLSSNAQAAHRRAIAAVGEPVTFQRIFGTAPASRTFSVTVTAVIRDYLPDDLEVRREGYPASRIGSITEGDRHVVVLEQDLIDKRFPVPLKKNDKVILVRTNQEFNVKSVDPSKRGLAGAIELVVTGI